MGPREAFVQVLDRWEALGKRRRHILIAVTFFLTFLSLILGVVLVDRVFIEASSTATLAPTGTLSASITSCDQLVLIGGNSSEVYVYEGVHCAVCVQNSNLTLPNSEIILLLEGCQGRCESYTLSEAGLFTADADSQCLDIGVGGSGNNESAVTPFACPAGFYVTDSSVACIAHSVADFLLLIENCEYLGVVNVSAQECIHECEKSDDCKGVEVVRKLDNNGVDVDEACFTFNSAVEVLCNEKVSDPNTVICRKIPDQFLCFDDVVTYEAAESLCSGAGMHIVQRKESDTDGIQLQRLFLACSEADLTKGCFFDDQLATETGECAFVGSLDGEPAFGIDPECNEEHGYCCEIPTFTPTISPTHSPTTELFFVPDCGVPDYANNDTGLNYSDAIGCCREHGAELATINSPLEQAFAWDICEAALGTSDFYFKFGFENPCGCWIGLNRLNEPLSCVTEECFSWLDGSTVVFDNWESYPLVQPNNLDNRNEQCVHMRPFTDGGWNDLPCTGNCDADDTKPFALCRVKTHSPTSSPTHSPTTTSQPTISPSEAPTTLPTRNPTISPFKSPTRNPTSTPTESPTVSPTIGPSVSPTITPTLSPSLSPSETPTSSPSLSPSRTPTSHPTTSPIFGPTQSPTISPTGSPSVTPTTSPSFSPTKSPTKNPTRAPSGSPTLSPSNSPTRSPTFSPTHSPSTSPTRSPTNSPSFSPSFSPTISPSSTPTFSPSLTPTQQPTKTPSQVPSPSPSSHPTRGPTEAPTISPTGRPTNNPTHSPTRSPTDSPSSTPTTSPTRPPSNAPTHSPTFNPTNSPSGSPTSAPTRTPTISPSRRPSSSPSFTPTTAPSNSPSVTPSLSPSISPSRSPTFAPSFDPTNAPSTSPSHSPSRSPSHSPTKTPTRSPSKAPTHSPTPRPTPQPINSPTRNPTESPLGSSRLAPIPVCSYGGTEFIWQIVNSNTKRSISFQYIFTSGVGATFPERSPFYPACIGVCFSEKFNISAGATQDIPIPVKISELYFYLTCDNDPTSICEHQMQVPNIRSVASCDCPVAEIFEDSFDSYTLSSELLEKWDIVSGIAELSSGPNCKDLSKCMELHGSVSMIQSRSGLLTSEVSIASSNAFFNRICSLNFFMGRGSVSIDIVEDGFLMESIKLSSSISTQSAAGLTFDISDGFTELLATLTSSDIYLDEIDVTCCCPTLEARPVSRVVAFKTGFDLSGSTVTEAASDPTAIIGQIFVPGNSFNVYSLGIQGTILLEFLLGVTNQLIIYEETFTCCNQTDLDDILVEVSVDGVNYIVVADSVLDLYDDYLVASTVRRAVVPLPNGACYKYIRLTDTSQSENMVSNGFDLVAVEAGDPCCATNRKPLIAPTLSPSFIALPAFAQTEQTILSPGAKLMFTFFAFGMLGLVVMIILSVSSFEHKKKQSAIDILDPRKITFESQHLEEMEAYLNQIDDHLGDEDDNIKLETKENAKTTLNILKDHQLSQVSNRKDSFPTPLMTTSPLERRIRESIRRNKNIRPVTSLDSL